VPDPPRNLDHVPRELLLRMFDELTDRERKLPAAGFPSSSYQARHPYYELVLCVEYLDLPRDAASLDAWVNDKKRQGLSMRDIEQFARDQVTNLRREIQQLLCRPQQRPEVPPPCEPSSEAERADSLSTPPAQQQPEPIRLKISPTRLRKSKPPRPKTLKELVAQIRLDSPRGRNVASSLEMMDDRIKDERPIAIHFDDIRETCHDGANVNDDTVEKTISRSRQQIRLARLPYTVKQSGHTVVVQKNPA
jgi:hypothetical protein